QGIPVGLFHRRGPRPQRRRPPCGQDAAGRGRLGGGSAPQERSGRNLMRFMCTVRMAPDIISNMTEADWARFQRDTQSFDDALMAAGRFVMASPLDGDKVRTIRLRAGSML